MTTRRTPAERHPTSDPLWYRDAVVYELHVRAFDDSDGDGVGDLRGLVDKLDYLQQLGVTAIWLLPFYPSPLRDDGYDIAEYKAIHPAYGTLADFRRLLREAHRRGLRVITELVLNHTSDQHPWFQRARRDRPGGPWHDFYVWSDTPDRYREARVIFRDFEPSNWSWDGVANAYYWHRFYSHQPDLNFDNPRVRRKMLEVVDFWLGLGVDGMRLDAIPYLFEREGTNCENLPETVAFLREVRAHIDARFPGRMLLAEANQWPEDAAMYFGDGDVCHMAFHFPLMPRMFMAIRMEDRYPIVDVLAQTPEIPENAQWALFLRNHDELTLEMVTDEERDYMYRSYAEDPQARLNLGIRRRLAPLLGNDRNLIEMMNGLLCSLPGTPVIYYGDEIGMGDNIYLGDRNGVRTPMQWSGDRNAGFSRANPQRLYLPPIIDPEYHYEALNVEAEQGNPNSLLWWTRRLIALRRRYQAFGRGSLDLLYPENHKVLVFLRQFRDERLLVVANLSRHAQYVELDLSRFEGMRPIELFGHTEFPRIGELPYLLTLGPHAFYWFALEDPASEPATGADAEPPTIEVAGPWITVFGPPARRRLEELLPRYLRSTRWFAGKSRRIATVEVEDAIEVPPAGARASDDAVVPAGYIVLLRVEYSEGDPETYLLPLTVRPARSAGRGRGPTPLARILAADGQHLLFDALHDPAFVSALLDDVARRRRLAGAAGAMVATRTSAFRSLSRAHPTQIAPSVLPGDQSNTSIVFGDRLIMKVFRRVGAGVNPDLEVGRFLTERTRFAHAPTVAGAIEYARRRAQPSTLAIVHGFVPNQGDVWRYTVDSLGQYLEEASARGAHEPSPDVTAPVDLVELATGDAPELAHETIGAYLESSRLLGERTAELHLALASDRDDPAFAPEPFTALAQRSLYQSLRTHVVSTFRMVRASGSGGPDPLTAVVDALGLEHDIVARLRRILEVKIAATRIRVHGDYHLGQVLHTGRDFVIIDFEGEPATPLGERRIKRSSLRDVAGMIRSFDYAARTAALASSATGMAPELLEPWADFWYRWVSATFLRAYLETARGASFVPSDPEQLAVLLDVHLLAKAAYELGYEANTRPDMIGIPADGILRLMAVPR